MANSSWFALRSSISAVCSDASSPASTASLICRIARGGIEQIVFAIFIAVSMTEPSATTSLASPIISASRAVTGWPVSIIFIA